MGFCSCLWHGVKYTSCHKCNVSDRSKKLSYEGRKTHCGSLKPMTPPIDMRCLNNAPYHGLKYSTYAGNFIRIAFNCWSISYGPTCLKCFCDLLKIKKKFYCYVFVVNLSRQKLIHFSAWTLCQSIIIAKFVNVLEIWLDNALWLSWWRDV